LNQHVLTFDHNRPVSTIFHGRLVLTFDPSTSVDLFRPSARDYPRSWSTCVDLLPDLVRLPGSDHLDLQLGLACLDLWPEPTGLDLQSWSDRPDLRFHSTRFLTLLDLWPKSTHLDARSKSGRLKLSSETVCLDLWPRSVSQPYPKYTASASASEHATSVNPTTTHPVSATSSSHFSIDIPSHSMRPPNTLRTTYLVLKNAPPPPGSHHRTSEAASFSKTSPSRTRGFHGNKFPKPPILHHEYPYPGQSKPMT